MAMREMQLWPAGTPKMEFGSSRRANLHFRVRLVRALRCQAQNFFRRAARVAKAQPENSKLLSAHANELKREAANI